MNRSGTSSKIIHYTMPKNEKRFMFQDKASLQQYNPAIELKGKLNIFKKPETSLKEAKEEPFRRMNLKNLPDSRRTLVPELNGEQTIIRAKSSLNMRIDQNPGNFASMINRTQEERNVTNNPKKIFEGQNNNSTLGVEPSKIIKSSIKFNEYSKYNQTTQITHLPGGNKRKENDINDDNLTKKRNDKSSNKKIETDYKSNISCLPATTVFFYFRISL